MLKALPYLDNKDGTHTVVFGFPHDHPAKGAASVVFDGIACTLLQREDALDLWVIRAPAVSGYHTAVAAHYSGPSIILGPFEKFKANF